MNLEPIGPLIHRVLDDIREMNADLIAVDSSTGDLPVRLKLSLFKMTAASARAHDRSTADEGDVLAAASFAKIKLTALRMFAPDHDEVEMAAKDLRREHWAAHASAVVKAEDLRRSYRDATGVDVSCRTVRRDLEDLGAKLVGKGMWLLPPGTTNGATS